MTVPVFIIASGRSGSTQLGHYYSQVHGAKYLGEIFKRRFQDEVGWDTVCQLIGDKSKARHLHLHDQIGYLEAICQNANAEFLIVKLFYKHSQGGSIWDYMFGASFPAIHLWRDDVFAQFISLQRASITGQWTQWKGKRYPENNTLVEFRSQDYLDWRSFMVSSHLEVQERLSARSNVGTMEYAKISDHGFIKALVNQTIGTDIVPREKLVKQAKKPALDYVKNRAEAAPFANDRLTDFI